MEEKTDDSGKRIDELLLRKLELMEEKISLIVQMEMILRNGHIELAKSRYILGKENVSVLQVPADEDQMVSLFDLETVTGEESSNGMPSFDISSKKLSKDGNSIKDPIKWFGVLVPQNLRTAQKCFQDSLFLAVKAANVQSELISVTNTLESMHSSIRKVSEGKQL